MAALLETKWALVTGLFGGEQQLIYFISYMYIISSVLLVVVLQGVTAPYGRYARKGWGLGMNPRLAWALQELPSLAVPVMLMFFSNSPRLTQLPNTIIVGLFIIHYIHRTFIFSLLIRGGKETPCSTFVMAFVFCSVNGYIQIRYLLVYADFTTEWQTRPSFYIGVGLFFIGMFINIQSDTILRNLRKPGEKGYKVPRGGMFEYVSGANFLGEILEWCGFAVANWTLPALAFAVMTVCNIGPRACQHHRWYREKFEDYPKNRKAVFPFIL